VEENSIKAVLKSIRQFVEDLLKKRGNNLTLKTKE
jgi:hypothetical protein